MSASYLKELEESLRKLESEQVNPVEASSIVGIVVADALNVRLVESAARQLELLPRVLREGSLTQEELARCEMIVADEAVALRIGTMFREKEERGEGVHPAVVAVMARGLDESGSGEAAELPPSDGRFDGLLVLPTSPARAAAQMSLLLYSHRAFARRYQTALEELNLNRRIFRSVTSGISIANALLPDLPLVYVNPAFEVITG